MYIHIHILTFTPTHTHTYPERKCCSTERQSEGHIHVFKYIFVHIHAHISIEIPGRWPLTSLTASIQLKNNTYTYKQLTCHELHIRTHTHAYTYNHNHAHRHTHIGLIKHTHAHSFWFLQFINQPSLLNTLFSSKAISFCASTSCMLKNVTPHGLLVDLFHRVFFLRFYLFAKRSMPETLSKLPLLPGPT